MKKAAIFFTVMLVACIIQPLLAGDQALTTNPLILESSAIHVKLFNVVDSPVILSEMKQINENGIFRLILENRAPEDINSIALAGFTFQIEGFSILQYGGFSKGIALNLASGEKGSFEIDLKEVINYNGFEITD